MRGASKDAWIQPTGSLAPSVITLTQSPFLLTAVNFEANATLETMREFVDAFSRIFAMSVPTYQSSVSTTGGALGPSLDFTVSNTGAREGAK